jgi:hypothetical protein
MGSESQISVKQIAEQLDSPYILRYCGDVDCTFLENSGVPYFPSYVKKGHMGVLPSAVGFDPIIRLQAGGLKAAEAMLKARYEFKGLPVVEII